MYYLDNRLTPFLHLHNLLIATWTQYPYIVLLLMKIDMYIALASCLLDTFISILHGLNLKFA